MKNKRITSDYDQRVYDEIVKPVKQAAEKAFKKCGLGKPRLSLSTIKI